MVDSIDLISEREIQLRSKVHSEDALRRSVVLPESIKNHSTGVAPFIIEFATLADDIPPWGSGIRNRDLQLRKFWPTESLLSSAVYASSVRNASFSFTLEGQPETKAAALEMLNRANGGKGWSDFILKLCTDMYTADNGAFVEIIRAESQSYLGNIPTKSRFFIE